MRTYAFRKGIVRKHLEKVRAARKAYAEALELWEDWLFHTHDEHEAPDAITEALSGSVSTKRWHVARANGQDHRFERVELCGSRSMIASCKCCGDERKPVAEGCGVRRVCVRCDVIGAVKRRARFGRARGRTIVEGVRYGLTRKKREGGRYTEKMLTLTLPHAELEDARGMVAKENPASTLHARVIALWKAWPLFWRKVQRHMKARREWSVAYHRSFEWTPGKDGHGHPHFHVYLWCPWIDAAILRSWWGDALRAVGWPVEHDAMGNSVVRVDLKMLRGFDLRAVHELLKGGRRSALTLSKVEVIGRIGKSGPGIDAFDYAEGWTLSDVEELVDLDTQARLYMALEARRLTQASRGFFEADDPPACTVCGSYGAAFRVRFEPVPDERMFERRAKPPDPYSIN